MILCTTRLTQRLVLAKGLRIIKPTVASLLFTGTHFVCCSDGVHGRNAWHEILPERPIYLAIWARHILPS